MADEMVMPTSEQLTVVRMAAKGSADAAIAKILFISESSVRRRLRELRDLTGTVTRSALCVEAARRGWLDKHDIDNYRT